MKSKLTLVTLLFCAVSANAQLPTVDTSDQNSICGTVGHGSSSGAIGVGQDPAFLQEYLITGSSAGEGTVGLIASNQQKSILELVVNRSALVTGRLEGQSFVVSSVQPVIACPAE